MKALTLALASLFTFMALATAAQAGHVWKGRTNQWGTTNWSDGHGNSFTCRTNQWGTTTCS